MAPRRKENFMFVVLKYDTSSSKRPEIISCDCTEEKAKVSFRKAVLDYLKGLFPSRSESELWDYLEDLVSTYDATFYESGYFKRYHDVMCVLSVNNSSQSTER